MLNIILAIIILTCLFIILVKKIQNTKHYVKKYICLINNNIDLINFYLTQPIPSIAQKAQLLNNARQNILDNYDEISKIKLHILYDIDENDLSKKEIDEFIEATKKHNFMLQLLDFYEWLKQY